MKCFDGRLVFFFASFLAAHSVSAMELGRCPGVGKDLEDKLWAARANVLGARTDAEREVAKPSAWNTFLADRLTLDVSYGNDGTWILQEDSRSYNFNRGDAKASYAVKYTLPFSVFAKPSQDAARAKKELQNFELNEQRVDFYDLLHDLRLALAELDVVKQNKGPDSAEASLADIKVSKVAIRLRHMTDGSVIFEPECIK